MKTRIPSPTRRNFTPAEWDLLVEWAGSVPLAEQARRLGRSYGVIIAARGTLAAQGRITGLRRPNPTYRRWTVTEDQQLEALLDRGMSYQAIAARMGRTYESVSTHAYKIGLSKMGGGTYSALGVAKLLGLRCSKAVALWIERGWITAKNISDGPQDAYWRITIEAVWAFLEETTHWMCWEPETITDPDLKAWAVELRATGPRWIPAGEARRRVHVTQSALAGYARRGLITAVFYSVWWYLESDLDTFVIPSERELDLIACRECGKPLRGNKAVGVHRAKVHGRKAA